MNVSKAQENKKKFPNKYKELLASPKAEQKVLDAINGGNSLFVFCLLCIIDIFVCFIPIILIQI